MFKCVSIKYEQTALQLSLKIYFYSFQIHVLSFSNMNVFFEFKAFFYTYYPNTE